MAKDFTFPFYVNDWLGGTMYFSYEQKGAYLELLLLQFNHGKFTETQVKQVLNMCYSHVWLVIKEKFKTDGEFFWNEKMKIVKEERRLFIESRRTNRLGKTKNKSKITSVNHENNIRLTHDKRMESESENENINEIKNEKLKSKFSEWLNFRKEKKKSVNKISAKKQIEFLLRHSVEDACAIIDQSIMNDWQGLFELKQNHKQNDSPLGTHRVATDFSGKL